MSMRDLLDSGCGQVNPVLKVASHFTNDVSLRESIAAAAGLGLGAAAFSGGRSGQVPGQSSASEVIGHGGPQNMSMLPPTTFRMDSLLNEIHSVDEASKFKGPVQAPAVADLAAQKAWVDEFVKSQQSPVTQRSPQVSQASNALSLNHYQQIDWSPLTSANYQPPSPWYSHPPAVMAGYHPMNQMMSAGPLTQGPTAQELLDESRWKTENLAERTELQTAAGDMLQSVSDPKLNATDFMKFVEKLSTGEKTFENTSNIDAETWAQEFASSSNRNHIGRNFDSSLANDQENQEFWKNLESEWEKLASEGEAPHPWLAEPQSLETKPYQFSEENPYIDTADPLAEGRKKLLAGDVPSAALLFESATQKSPDNPECWLMLGTTQALNEQDPLAIAALYKCLELQPDNLTASMSLAASLANESYPAQACEALKNWMKHNPKYSMLVPEDLTFSPKSTASLLSRDKLAEAQRMFIEAARLNPTTGVDPDVQSGLGILFSLSSDYEKASDCFRAALNVTPEDALLWNRLGATLANGGDSPEAVGAYRKALEYLPGFIRTRYNLGIACVNLGAYKEAAEHFLQSLNMQAAGKNTLGASTSQGVMSESIWSSFRMVLHLMDKGHLAKHVDSRDLSFFNNELGLGER